MKECNLGNRKRVDSQINDKAKYMLFLCLFKSHMVSCCLNIRLKKESFDYTEIDIIYFYGAKPTCK